MPKIRGYKPEIWTDAKFVTVEPLARLLYMGMWSYACDNGHVENEPMELKLRILPADNCDVADLLAQLLDVGLVVDRQTHLHIPKLRAHQRVDVRYFTSCPRCDPAETPPSTRRGPGGDTRGALRDHPVLPLGPRVDGDGDSEMKGKDGDSDRSRTSARRATSLPKDFAPTSVHERIAAEEHLDLKREFQRFVDHHEAKGSTFKDWNAALRNWLRRAGDFRRTSPAAKAASSTSTDWMNR